MDKMIADAVHGERAARNALVQRLTPVIRRRAQEEDLVQDVLEALFRDGARALGAWRPERGLCLEGYVGMVASRVVASAKRSGRRSGWREEPTEPEELADAAGPAGGGQLDARDALGRLLEALSKQLSPRALDLFQKLFVEEQSIDDVSQTTGLSPCAVYQWRSRLRRTAAQLATE